MPDYKKYYDILGIDQKSSVEDTKKAYKKLAKRFHPDTLGQDATPGEKRAAEEYFKRIQEAYEIVLKDVEIRSGPDRQRENEARDETERRRRQRENEARDEEERRRRQRENEARDEEERRRRQRENEARDEEERRRRQRENEAREPTRTYDVRITGRNVLRAFAVMFAIFIIIPFLLGFISSLSDSDKNSHTSDIKNGLTPPVANQRKFPEYKETEAITELSDDFSSARLDPKYIIINKNQGSSIFLSGTGSLKITASPNNGGSDYGSHGHDAPRILIPIKGDMTGETKMTFSPTRDYQSAGIIACYDDNSDSSTCDIVSERAFYSQKGGSVVKSGGISYVSYISNVTYFKLTKKGMQFAGWYSSDGVNWILNSEGTLRKQIKYIGLFAIRYPSDGDMNIYSVAEFDYIKMWPGGSLPSSSHTPEKLLKINHLDSSTILNGEDFPGFELTKNVYYVSPENLSLTLGSESNNEVYEIDTNTTIPPGYVVYGGFETYSNGERYLLLQYKVFDKNDGFAHTINMSAEDIYTKYGYRYVSVDKSYKGTMVILESGVTSTNDQNIVIILFAFDTVIGYISVQDSNDKSLNEALELLDIVSNRLNVRKNN